MFSIKGAHLWHQEIVGYVQRSPSIIKKEKSPETNPILRMSNNAPTHV